LKRTEKLLKQYGHVQVADRLADTRAKLAAGDQSAIETALAESTGSMGPLNDQVLFNVPGDHIEPAEIAAANLKLRELIEAVRNSAKVALAAPR